MKAGSDEPPDKPSRPQPDPQGDGKASDDKPGTGDRPKSCGCTAGVLGADSNVGPICIWGVFRVWFGSACHWAERTFVFEFVQLIAASPDTTTLQTSA